MISEIGAAQQRLFDDNTSSAGQHLPSTATPYASEISQPGSFPAIESFQYQHGGDFDGLNGGQLRQDAPYEATQLIAPIQGQGQHCDYDTPATSNHIDSPLDGLAAQVNPITVPVHLDDGVPAIPLPNTSQQSKFLQHATYSPHDTEPISSIASTGLNNSKKDNEEPILMSPQHSQASAHDELSVPAISVEISSVKKKRGRPKKQLIPEDDEDDELSLSKEDGFGNPKPAVKRGPGRPPKSAEVVDTDENTEASEIEGAKTTDPVAIAPNKDNATTEDPAKAAPKEPKKKKAKRSKIESDESQGSRKPDVDDDVIWVDSRPLQTADGNAATEPSSKTNSTKPSPEPTTATDESNPAPVPKKRGRKRKNAPEQLNAQAPPTAEKPQPETQVLATTAESTVESNELPTTEPSANEIQPPQSRPQPQTEESTTSNFPPETPHKQDVATPNKTMQRDSPISSTGKVPYRVGLSRRARIAPLLKVVRK